MMSEAVKLHCGKQMVKPVWVRPSPSNISADFPVSLAFGWLVAVSVVGFLPLFCSLDFYNESAFSRAPRQVGGTRCFCSVLTGGE